jgi:hypothetical protein
LVLPPEINRGRVRQTFKMDACLRMVQPP